MEEYDNFGHATDLAKWVMEHCNRWRDYYESNYASKHEEYYRLYRSIWSAEDQTRESERSRLIAPATAQAVESCVAEVEEATFGRGKLFDVKDNAGDTETRDVAVLRTLLHEALQKARVRSSVAEVLINAAVTGTGIGEIVIEEQKEYVPGTRPLMDGDMREVGVTERLRPLVKLNPIQPRNFLIDPTCTSVDDALGCAVDTYVPMHQVVMMQESGVYRDVPVSGSPADEEIEPDPELTSDIQDRVRLTKYYGRVPRDLLLDEGVDEDDIVEPGSFVEAVVVLANEGTVLKAIPSPYMCQDRPVVAFQWDIVPSVFWGRGVAEKAYMSQKALDAELRARIDALAYTTHPMLAADATRIPRGHKLEVRAGRMLLTNGNPADALMPFKFGQLDQVTFAQAGQLQQMVSQATGAAEATATLVQNDVTAAGMSMSQGAMVKRQKRTLVNFQENFLIPFVTKAAHRYMQFDPERFPVNDYKFVVFSSLGAMAREYEVAQLSQMLQVVPPTSPAHGPIIKGIVDHMNVANREELIAAIDAGNQPDPDAQQRAQAAEEAQTAVLQGQLNLLRAQSGESAARANKYVTEARLMPAETALKYADQNNDGQVDDDFEKRIKLAELLIKEKQVEAKAAPSPSEDARAMAEAELIRRMTPQIPQQ